MRSGNQRCFIEIAYHGGKYHGWQLQKNAVTVQEILDRALSTLLRKDIKTLGCGRTDTGVHAKQLFAHFDCLTVDVDQKYESLSKSLNAILPKDIAVRRLFPVAHDLHARFDAISRSYEYHIHFQKDPFLNGLSWQLRDYPDLLKMNAAAKIMMEYNDFSCFSKSHTQVSTNLCEIYLAEWSQVENGSMVFNITANRFLRNMVRAIVGTLLEIGFDKNSVESIRSTIESKNRSVAGVSVPAEGLYLTEVKYPGLNAAI